MAKKSNNTIALEVLCGKWGSGDTRKKKLKKAGYDYNAIQRIVNDRMTKKPIDTVAHEVINGLWGSGNTMKKCLTVAGYNYNTVQNRVNEILNPKKYSGELPTMRLVKSTEQVCKDSVRWAKWIAGDNRFHYGHGKACHKCGCYFCGTEGLKKGHDIKDWDKTYVCNTFVTAAYAHGGCVPSILEMCQKCRTMDTTNIRKSKLFKKVPKKKANLKAGMVFLHKDGKGGLNHVSMYAGDGKVAHAYHEDDNKPNSKSWNSSILVGTLTDSLWTKGKYCVAEVYEFVGSVDATMPIRHGEVSYRVELWQNFLIWKGLLPADSADGIFGNATFGATKAYQNLVGITQDGIVGVDTLAHAEAESR